MIDKRYIYAFSGILVVAIIGGTLAVIGEFHEKNSQKYLNKDLARFEKEENIQRLVANTSSGVEISIAPTNSGSITNIYADFKLEKGALINQNSELTISGNIINNVLKISVNSNDLDIVKYLQTSALNGESGEFGFDFNKSFQNYSEKEKFGKKSKHKSLEKDND